MSSSSMSCKFFINVLAKLQVHHLRFFVKLCQNNVAFSSALFQWSFFCCRSMCDMSLSECRFWFYKYDHLYQFIRMLWNTCLFKFKHSFFASKISSTYEYFPLTIFLIFPFIFSCLERFPNSDFAWSIFLLYICGYIK